MVDLALIFQPGVLSHPDHAMRPKEHVLSQQVLEFLIEHQDNFLIGMQLVSLDNTLPTGQTAKSPGGAGGGERRRLDDSQRQGHQ